MSIRTSFLKLVDEVLKYFIFAPICGVLLVILLFTKDAYRVHEKEDFILLLGAWTLLFACVVSVYSVYTEHANPLTASTFIIYIFMCTIGLILQTLSLHTNLIFPKPKGMK
ncbi:MAG: hypothetical protein RLZZ308_451 [Candidatus Parcubacteria bacterium]|jgi:Mn2+/Fe2+ NRAMP family transporter